MKSKEEFIGFIDNNLSSSLGDLEELRKSIKSGYLNWISVFLLGGGIVLAAKFVMHLKWLLWPSLALFLVALIFIILVQKPMKEFRARYKSDVISRIIEFIQPGLSYMPQAMISEHEFRHSGLFLKEPDRYHGEDMVSGTVGKTDMKFSEVRAQYKTETRDSKGNRHTQWHDIFRGIFFVADFNKDFATRTLVLPDKAEKLFGSFLGSAFQKMNKFRGELVKLENPEFEKEFAVYGEDQIESRYVITPDLMEKILDFRKKHRQSISISFISSKMYVAIPVFKDLFEPNYAKSVFDKAVMTEYFEYLRLVLGIVEDFNLNTRIWGKK